MKNASEPQYNQKWNSLPVRPELKGLINHASPFPLRAAVLCTFVPVIVNFRSSVRVQRSR